MLAVLVLSLFFVYQPAWHGGQLWDDDAPYHPPRVAVLAGPGAHLDRSRGHAPVLPLAAQRSSGSSIGSGATRRWAITS